MPKIQKNQIPIEIDAHFKYRCPNPKCGLDNWISLKEAQTKGFVIVCYCEQVFTPQRIKSIDIVYRQDSTVVKTHPESVTIPTEPVLQVEQPKEVVQIINDEEKKVKLGLPKIPLDSLEKSCKILVALGYTKSEAKEIILRGFDDCEIVDPHLLVKHSLSLIGGIDEQPDATFDI